MLFGIDKKEKKMKFDGSKLKDGSRTVANVRGDKIYDGSGSSKCLVNIRNDKIYEGSGSSKCIANLRRDKLYEGSGSSKTIATTKDIDKAIDGPGGLTKAALWIAKVR
jgi:hypothetical protein